MLQVNKYDDEIHYKMRMAPASKARHPMVCCDATSARIVIWRAAKVTETACAKNLFRVRLLLSVQMDSGGEEKKHSLVSLW